MKPYELIIEEEACWGCRACELACQQEHDFRIPSLLRVVEDGPRWVEQDPHFQFNIRICRHCDEAPCLPGCPVEAISKRSDGVVLLDGELCTGCGLCLQACPWDAIWLDPQTGKAVKCDLCHRRVDHGLYPACADNVCMAHCIYFGPRQETETQIQAKRARRRTR